MRKFPFLATVAAALLCGCSDGDDSGSTDYSTSSVEAVQYVPIQLGIQNSNSVFVRGTGTVGDTLGSTKNIWQAQRLKVYMLHKDSIALVNDLQGKAIYDNVEFYAPGMKQGDTNHGGLFTGITAANDSTIRPLNDTVKYYPLNGNFDFYGYRMDGADTAAVVFNPDNDITVGFKINGTQDIMVAKAVPSANDITKLGSGATRFFSSYAARRGVHPNLKFRHLLTRLSFNVIPCGPKTVDTNTYIVVDSIRLIAANTKGTLTIAKDGDVEGNTQVIAWEGSTLATGDTLSLMQRDTANHVTNFLDSCQLVRLDTVALKDSVYWADVPDGTTIEGTNTNKLDSATVHIGEAMLLAPATEYKMIMYVRQKLPVTYSGGTASAAWQYNKLESTIKFNSPTSTGFLAGKTYDVKAKIYSIEEIIITASLTGWEQGEDVHIDTEDEP